MVHNERIRVVLGPTVAVAAGTGATWRDRIDNPGKYIIESAYLMPDDAQTANGTNYSTYTLNNVTKSAVIATRAYSATDSVAGTAEALSVTASAAQVDSGDVLSWVKAETASGLAGRNRVIVTLRRIA